MREAACLIDIGSSTKTKFVFLGGLRNIRVHDVVPACDRVE